MEEKGEDESPRKHHGLRGFKFSPLCVLCPVRKVKIKRFHYRVLLVISGVGFYICHAYLTNVFIVGVPAEIHWAVLVNTLFALDPTV